MKYQPRPYQQLAIQRMVDSPYQLLALRMGAGKSSITLTALSELMHDRFEINRVLVIAPLRVAQMVWHTEVQKWDHTRHLKVSRVLGTAKERLAALTEEADIHVINVENLPWLVGLWQESGQPWPWDCLVIDENKGLKDRGSRTFKVLKAVRDKAKRMYILTGTPAPNSLLELWPQISILDRGQRLGKGITAYRDKWFVPDKRNGAIVYSWKPRPGAKDEIYAAVKDAMLSVDSDIQLPQRIDNYIPVAFDMTRYNDLKANLVSGNVIAVNPAVLAGKLGQMANGAVYDDQGNVEVVHSAKLDALEEIVDQGEPVLVFTAYQHDQTRIRQRIPQARVFDGPDALLAWQKGHIQVLLMHPASGGHGVDGLQLGGSVAVWYGMPYSLDQYEQANARLHRPGQANSVTVHHLVAQGTVDEHIVRVLQGKGDLQQALLDAVKEIVG